MSVPQEDCLFCRIVAGEVPADVVHRSERSLAFRDIDPKAPTHVLVVPLVHHCNAADLADNDPATLADMFVVADIVADQEQIIGYRTVFNTGAEAGQTVFHAHLHLLGGRSLTWPPG
ncbi:MAG: histidine triad nucleotide-binding protein [Nocardioides sp.]|nr:histidine triad nucleotide-binding protein [Nocardioides sp.]